MVKFKIAFICQAVDEDDPIVSFSLDWIENLLKNEKVEKLYVLGLRVGEHNFNVKNNKLQIFQIKKNNKIKTLINFFKIIQKIVKDVDFFFIHQGGPYPLLLMPYKILFGKKIFQWKAHPYISSLMKFYAIFCDDLIFTSVKDSFPLNLKKIKTVGQGIDTSKFKPLPVLKKRGIVVFGRLSRVKNIHLIIEMAKVLRDSFNLNLKIDFIGPYNKKDEYMLFIFNMVRDWNLSDNIKFLGKVNRKDLPKILPQYKIMVSANDGALDKAMVEGMACGLPVVSHNSSFKSILTKSVVNYLWVSTKSPEEYASKVYKILTNDNLKDFLSKEVRKIAANHDIKNLIDRILIEIGNYYEKKN